MKMVNRIKTEPQWAFNFILSILVAIIGWNAVQFSARIERIEQTKAEKEQVVEICRRIDMKADTATLNRIEAVFQRQMQNLTVEIVGLRQDFKDFWKSEAQHGNDTRG